MRLAADRRNVRLFVWIDRWPKTSVNNALTWKTLRLDSTLQRCQHRPSPYEHRRTTVQDRTDKEIVRPPWTMVIIHYQIFDLSLYQVQLSCPYHRYWTSRPYLCYITFLNQLNGEKSVTFCRSPLAHDATEKTVIFGVILLWGRVSTTILALQQLFYDR